MRAAAIFGLGSSAKDLAPFQKNSAGEWRIGMPGSSAEADAILVFGGDGTVHRHLSSLVKLNLPVLTVPCGSGNDFARALGLGRVRDSLEAWRKFVSGREQIRTIDLGAITPLAAEPQRLERASTRTPVGMSEDVPFPISEGGGKAGTPHYFCCIAGLGLDGEVARRANRLPRWLRGHGGYALSLPVALVRFVALPMKLLLPGTSGSWAVHSEKPMALAAFANTPVFGGGMKIAPQAQLDDGQLDICLVTDINRLKLFCLFPSVYFGRHLGMEDVEYFQAARLRLETEHPMEVWADGEYVCRTPVEVSIQPGALRVIV